MKQKCYLTMAMIVILMFIPNIVTAEDTDEMGIRKNYAAAPIIISNPNIGSGLGVTGMYFFDIGDSTETKPRSSAQIVGAYTNTDSYFGGLLTNLHMKNDRIRTKAGVFHASINNEYRDPEGGEANFATNLLSGYGQATYRILNNFFIGAQLVVSDIQYDPETSNDKDYLDRVGAEDSSAAGVGPVLFYDTRDSIHYPTTGTYAEIKGLTRPYPY